ncbi:hypothetical protein C2G38_2160959 [Gigaspora rosea]|uniref:Uncharacterized protein n=1 Tax=Gigaspora rosea TaxID=44941 RepID=A0A397W0Y7_9GLOM|nr:hypothetical protein C2G38_2160959 [Gigaspora rosea]
MRYKPDTSATTASEPPANTSGLGAGRSTRNEDIQKNSFASTIEETTQEKTTANLNMQDPTYSPDMEPSSNLNMQDLYLPDLEVPQTTNMHNPQHPDGNTVEGLQDMKNMKLCISTPSTIRSRASTPTPKPTYSQAWHYDHIVKALETREGVEELADNKFATQPLQCTYTPLKPRLPSDPRKIKTTIQFTFPIKDDRTAKKFIEEIRPTYYFTLPLSTNIMTANPTDKLTLPTDPQQITEYYLTIPISTSKQLTDTVQLL